MVMYISLMGRKDIHVRLISRSYRIRGMVVRVEMNIAISRVDCATIRDIDIVGDEVFCSRRIEDIKDTNIMLRYSAMKMNANMKLEYSVLNPDTSSLSPSAKSNGVRLVSASKQMNHA